MNTKLQAGCRTGSGLRSATRPDGRSLFGTLSLSCLTLLLGGCLVGPSFETPPVTLNPEWAGKDGQRVTAQAAGCERWWEVFQDPVLDRLVRQAREQNLSLQVAGLRILEARAQLGIAIGQQ